MNLAGEDGNAFNILGLCQRAMRKAGLSKSERGRREHRIAITTSLTAAGAQDGEAIWCHFLESRASRSATYFFNSTVSRSATTTWVGPQKDSMGVALRWSSFTMSPPWTNVHNETIPVRKPSAATGLPQNKHCYRLLHVSCDRAVARPYGRYLSGSKSEAGESGDARRRQV